jgi:hypothetical protein
VRFCAFSCVFVIWFPWFCTMFFFIKNTSIIHALLC